MAARRQAGLALLLVAAGAFVLVHFVQAWAAVPPDVSRTSDFAGTYVAATEWRAGNSGSMYDESAERQVMVQLGAPLNHLWIPFVNPPAAAILASPLTLFDASTAYRVWSMLQLLLVIAAVVIATRAAPWPQGTSRLLKLAIASVATATFGVGLLFIEAQWDGLLVLGVSVAYACWRGGRPAYAGLVVGFTAALAKPHLALGIAAFMLGRRDWRAALSAAAGGAAALLSGLAFAGVSASGAFITALLQPSNSPLAQMQGATGLFSSLLGGAAGAYPAGVVASLAAVAAAAWLGASTRSRPVLFEPAFAGAVVLSVFAAPHVLGHDLALLSPVLVISSAWLLRESVAVTRSIHWPDRTQLALITMWIALSFATMFDLGKKSVGFPGRVTPWVLLLLASACMTSVARASRNASASTARTDALAAPA